MNCKIPFTKDIDMERKVHEITSISLEHEIKIEDNTLKGNFIISGDFRSHEVSVNKEAFSYVLPFEIDLLDNIDESSVEFMIDDFTYEVVDSSILRVNIDFNVIGSLLEKEEKEEETVFRDATDLFEETSDEEMVEIPTYNLEESEEQIEDIGEVKEGEIIEDVKEDTLVETVQENNIVEETSEDRNENMDTQSKTEDTIINSLNGVEEEYATYHIHMVSDGESVETICTMYNSNLNILSEYNDLNNLAQGDKLIIPENNE